MPKKKKIKDTELIVVLDRSGSMGWPDRSKIIETISGFNVLKSEGLINNNILYVKVFKNGPIDKAITLVDLRVSAGAKKAIEEAGGKVESNG